MSAEAEVIKPYLIFRRGYKTFRSYKQLIHLHPTWSVAVDVENMSPQIKMTPALFVCRDSEFISEAESLVLTSP